MRSFPTESVRRACSVTGVFIMLGILGVVSGCEDAVNPFVEDGRYYTIYGYLDTGADTQYVRVVPLRRTLDEGEVEIDAAVTSTAQESGQVVVWQDSVVHFDDGSVGHVFYAPFRPIPGWTYRIEARRSDGAASWSETTVPPAQGVRVMPPDPSTTSVSQQVIWDGVDRAPFGVEVWYRFVNVSPSAPFLHVVLPYDELGREVDGGWEVMVHLARDRDRITEILDITDEFELALLGVGMRLNHPDDQWRPPGGVFDPEVLVQPGLFSNVENGFGFFGAVNRYTVEWTLGPDVMAQLGYVLPGKATP